MIASSYVGCTVAGWSPAVAWRPSRNWFHSTTGSGVELDTCARVGTGAARLAAGRAADMPSRAVAADRRATRARLTMNPPGRWGEPEQLRGSIVLHRIVGVAPKPATRLRRRRV